MEITLNNSGISYGNLNGVEHANKTVEASSKDSISSSQLTITRGIASTEDIEAAKIPESELIRDDALGKLVTQAFNLPPPAMPNFN